MAASGVDGFAVGVVVETAWGQSMPYKEVDASSCVHGGNKIIDMTSLICPRYQRPVPWRWYWKKEHLTANHAVVARPGLAMLPVPR
jgi:hypothetical protein